MNNTLKITPQQVSPCQHAINSLIILSTKALERTNSVMGKENSLIKTMLITKGSGGMIYRRDMGKWFIVMGIII